MTKNKGKSPKSPGAAKSPGTTPHPGGKKGGVSGVVDRKRKRDEDSDFSQNDSDVETFEALLKSPAGDKAQRRVSFSLPDEHKKKKNDGQSPKVGQSPKQAGQGLTPNKGQSPKQGQTPKQSDTPKQGQPPNKGQTPKQGPTPKQQEVAKNGGTPKQGQTPKQAKSPNQAASPKVGDTAKAGAQQTPKQTPQGKSPKQNGVAGAKKGKSPAAVVGKKRERESEEEESDEEEKIEEQVAPVTKKQKQQQPKQQLSTAVAESTTKFSDADLNAELRLKDAMNRRTLFVKNLPRNTAEQEIKALSADILNVRQRIIFKKGLENPGYAYVEFKDEATAEANYRKLQGKKVGGAVLAIDYVGVKSVLKPSSAANDSALSSDDLDPTRLYITGFPRASTVEQALQKLFSTATSLVIPKRNKDQLPLGYAFAVFDSEDACKRARASVKDQTVDGRPLVVMYAKKSSKPVPAELKKSSKKSKKEAAKLTTEVTKPVTTVAAATTATAAASSKNSNKNVTVKANKAVTSEPQAKKKKLKVQGDDSDDDDDDDDDDEDDDDLDDLDDDDDDDDDDLEDDDEDDDDEDDDDEDDDDE